MQTMSGWLRACAKELLVAPVNVDAQAIPQSQHVKGIAVLDDARDAPWHFVVAASG